MNKSTKNIIMIILVVIMIISFVTDFFYYRNISIETKLISDLQQVFYEEYSDNLHAANITRQLSVVAEKIDLLSTLFLSEDKIIDFIGQIEEMGQKNNVLVTTKNVDASNLVDKSNNDKKEYGEVLIQLNVSGTSAAVISYIEILESLPYYSNINSLRLVKNESSEKISSSADILLGIIIRTK